MKSDKGITLTSLIVYIIIFCITIATISMFTNYFKENVDETVMSVNTPEQYSRFTTYLTDDLNSVNFGAIEIASSDYGINSIIDITLLDGTHHKYMYSNNQIYYIDEKVDTTINKKIKLCSQVSNYSFNILDNTLQISIIMNENIYSNNYDIQKKGEN